MSPSDDHDPRLEHLDWPVWLAAILPAHCTAPFAEHHRVYWEWLWAITPGVRPEAFIGVWARGGAKSTSAEAGVVAIAARRKRRYGLYVCDTQDRADDHVGNVGLMLESDPVELFYPELATRRVTKYGHSRGWRRNRLWTSSGFVLDAIGLDTAARGVKLEDQRPDLMVIDDIDGRHDTDAATRKKIETLTESVIPAGSDDLAIVAIQNLVKAGGVFDQLAHGHADFLRRRQLSGPIPAVRGLEVERQDGRDIIVKGEAVWAGQDIDTCQAQIDDWGLPAFNREAQHEVADAEGALLCHAQINAGRVGDFSDLEELVVAVDPSGGRGAGHDEQGIVAVGRGDDGHGYVLEDATCSLSPMGWGKRAVRLAVELNADRIVVEDNYGGEMTAATIRNAADALVRGDGEAAPMPEAARFGTDHAENVKQLSASWGSKKTRASTVAALYGEKEREETWPDATLHHVGELAQLEAEWCGWDPEGAGKSPNRIDAETHGVVELGLAKPRGRRLSVRGAA